MKIFFKVLLSTGLIIWFLSKNDPTSIFRAIASVGLGTTVAIIFITIFALVLGSYKWQLFFANQKLSKLIRLNLIATYYSTFLFGQLSGEVVKSYLFSNTREGIIEGFASVLFDKILALIAILALAFSASFLMPEHMHSSVNLTLALLLVASLAAIVCARLGVLNALFIWFQSRFAKKFTKWDGLLESGLLFIKFTSMYARNNKILLLNLFLSILYNFSSSIVTYLISRNMGLNVSLADWVWINCVLSVVLLLPFTIGGIGLRELTFVGMLHKLNVSSENALAISFIIFGLQILLSLAGLAFDLTGPKFLKEAKK